MILYHRLKTSDLTGPALDYAVAKADGRNPNVVINPRDAPYVNIENPPGSGFFLLGWNPSVNWKLAGPIIEQARINTKHELPGGHWSAYICFEPPRVYGSGPTLLIAAMRCYVALKLGDEVDIPKELVN